jgi:biotin transport system substrate-specific component
MGMSAVPIVALPRTLGAGFLRWRAGVAVLPGLAMAAAMAGATGLAAQVEIRLPWTPVPITGQTFAVLVSGILLGRGWGGVSQFLYIGLGAVGVPWFAGWSGGPAALFGPTGGYLLGFVAAALFLGHFADPQVRPRRWCSTTALFLFANFALIHLPGLVHLRFWLWATGGATPSLLELAWMGTVPFVAGDLVKVAAAVAVVRGLTPGDRADRPAVGGPQPS